MLRTTCTGISFGSGSVDRRTSLLGSMAQCWCFVCGPLLAAPSLVAAGMGSAGGTIGGFSICLLLFVLLAAAVGGVGFYCWRVTGIPVLMPYQGEGEPCAVAPSFIWKSVGSQPPVYRSEMVRSLYATAEVGRYTLARTKLGFLY